MAGKNKLHIKMISRNPDDYLRETKKDIHKVQRNFDPSLHPFEATREYSRAMNATKLERVFAKPFLGSLDGHRDSIHCLQKHPAQLATCFSGSCDGEIRMWNIPKKKCIRVINAHDGYVRGICFNPNGEYFFSCGDDKAIKQWRLEPKPGEEADVPINTILGKTVFHSMDHHWENNQFATCGQRLDIWDEERAEPIRSFSWGVDSISSVKFNPVETNILCATGSDRSLLLYDMRGSVPLRKVILRMNSNMVAWNPMEAFTFTAANEDYNLYTFDMRQLKMPINMHVDHVSAVLGVDYSPTGKEFVSGSYDKTVRIFAIDQAHSREVYHTKRMQRIQCVMWSRDNKYLLSGSDEMGIRLWKANASEKLGTLHPREREAFAYNEKLKEKFAHHPEVKRIARHRHVPKNIYSARREHAIIKSSHKRKEQNRRIHSKKGTVPLIPDRKKSIVGEVE